MTKKRCPVPIRSVLEVEPEALVVLIRQTDADGNDTLIAYDDHEKVSGTDPKRSRG